MLAGAEVAAPVRRVCICVNSLWNVLNFRMSLVAALQAAGCKVTVLAPMDDNAAALREAGCHVIPVRFDSQGVSVIRDLRSVLDLGLALHRERPDVVLGFTVKPNIYGSLAARVFGVAVINNISGLGTVFIRGGWLTAVVRLLYAMALRGSTRVFFQNPDDLRLFRELRLVQPGQADLLPGSGVDLSRFRPVPLTRRRSGEPFGFLLVARLLWDKGIAEFVEAARLVRRTHPRARFQLLGAHDTGNPAAVDRATMEAWAKEGVVEYLGATTDVRPHLKQADCVVLPSYREGTPRALLEAAAMGRPLIATDVPGCREVVEDGVNGYLCKVRDVDDLAHAMMRMIRLPPDQRTSMGAAGRERIERQFDEQLVIARYLAALEDLLAN